MDDFEDTDFCVESWSFLGKKASKKKHQKLKNGSPQKTQLSALKVKKKSKFKEAMLERKERKKKKRKDKNKEKKKKKMVEFDDLAFAQGSGAQAELLKRLALINQNQSEDLNPGRLPEIPVKEAKRKKHVAFALLPSYVRIKRPRLASSSPREADVAREGKSCSRVVSTGPAQSQPRDDFQCASDDVNSQDLFITQKTFRASPSSSEASDGVASPPAFGQRDERQQGADRCQTKADKLSEDSLRLVQEAELKIKTEQDEGVYELHQGGKMSFQTQMKFKVNIPKQEKESVHIEPKVGNPYTDEPFVVNPTPDVASCLQHVSETPQPVPRTTDVSTQTDNFFSAELSLYLDFCRKRSAAAGVEDPKPLDLSLPQRARNDLRSLTETPAGDTEAGAGKTSLRGEISDGGEGASASTQTVNLSRLVETTPSPPSETDTKSADMTASSEDDHFCRSGKRDLLQVGAVQLRLNKPFFFKTKGDCPSPRPESPLMKLSQGRDTKHKKRR